MKTFSSSILRQPEGMDKKPQAESDLKTGSDGRGLLFIHFVVQLLFWKVLSGVCID